MQSLYLVRHLECLDISLEISSKITVHSKAGGGHRLSSTIQYCSQSIW